MICKCQDDNGNTCGRKMTREEHEQDGICNVCADSLWNLHIIPQILGEKTKPFIHKRDENEK